MSEWWFNTVWVTEAIFTARTDIVRGDDSKTDRLGRDDSSLTGRSIGGKV